MTSSMPTWSATARAARPLSPVSRTGSGRGSRSRAIASALVGLTVSATTSTARAAPSQPTKIGGVPERLGGRPWRLAGRR